MAKTKQRRPDRPKRPPRQLSAAPNLDYVEVEEGQEEQPEPERLLLFTWKEKEYFVEAPEPTVILEVLEVAADKSDIGAMGYMLKKSIGDENYKVLKQIPNLSNDEMNQIFDRAMDFMMGQIGELGN